MRDLNEEEMRQIEEQRIHNPKVYRVSIKLSGYKKTIKRVKKLKKEMKQLRNILRDISELREN